MISREKTWFYLQYSNGQPEVVAAIEALSLPVADARCQKLLGFNPIKQTNIVVTLAKWRGPKKWEFTNRLLGESN